MHDLRPRHADVQPTPRKVRAGTEPDYEVSPTFPVAALTGTLPTLGAPIPAGREGTSPFTQGVTSGKLPHLFVRSQDDGYLGEGG